MACLGVSGFFANIMTLAPLFYAEVLQQIQEQYQLVKNNIVGNLRIANLENVGNVCSTNFENVKVVLLNLG